MSIGDVPKMNSNKMNQKSEFVFTKMVKMMKVEGETSKEWQDEESPLSIQHSFAGSFPQPIRMRLKIIHVR